MVARPPSTFAVKENINQAANIMVGIVKLDGDTDFSTANYRPAGKGAAIRTYASEILPDAARNDPCPRLDRALRDLICLCRATTHNEIPPIGALSNQVMNAIEERDQEFYSGDPMEGDAAIKALLKRLLIDGRHHL